MDLEKKLKEMEASVSKLEATIEDREKIIDELNTQVKTLSEENKQLDKLLAIEREKVLALEAKIVEEKEMRLAESTMDSILAESRIPERLYSKVKKQIDYKSFKNKNENFDVGSDAFKRFVSAFKAEVGEWEASLGSTLHIGVYDEKNDGGLDMSEYARNLARQFAGRIRSD